MTPLHRVRFDWPTNITLEIEWAKGSPGAGMMGSVPIPYLTECEKEAALDPLGRRGVPALCWRGEGDALFEPLQLRENAEYLVDVTLPITHAEAKAAWEGNHSWPFGPRLGKFYTTEPPKRWRDNGGSVQITGRLNFGSQVGLADLTVEGAPPLRAEVACAKIGYFDDFRALLDQIAEEFVALLFQVDAPTAARMEMSDVEEVPDSVLLFHLRRIMSHERLPAAIETILQSMHSSLESYEQLTPLSLLRNPTPERVPNALPELTFEAGGPLAHLFGGFTPTMLPEQLKRETIDTPENRYVKAFLGDLLHRSQRLASSLRKAEKPTSAAEVAVWCESLDDFLMRDAWQEVGEMRQFPSNSPTLLRRQGYQDVLECDLTLQYGLRLPWQRGRELADGLDGDLRPVSELYEFWCFFVLRTALREVCGAEVRSRSSLIRYLDAGGISVDLQRGKESQIVFHYPLADEDGNSSPTRPTRATVTLFFNRTFRRGSAGNDAWTGSYSAAFHPDYSILIEIPFDSGQQRHWLHFDAKYRLDISQWDAELRGSMESVEATLEAGSATEMRGESIPPESATADGDNILFPDERIDYDEGGEDTDGIPNLGPAESMTAKTTVAARARLPLADDAFQRADLYKMHTYRDSLLGSRGAYILFPGMGETEQIFIRNPGKRYSASLYDFPSVGAFQLRPQSAPLQRNAITTFLTTVLSQLCSGRFYQEETGMF